jgi:hypothetical protein
MDDKERERERERELVVSREPKRVDRTARENAAAFVGHVYFRFP